ncbi:hypothetical protein [Croceicoccus naphthovorans]|uniref:hypothetical protein n=1 Tax=Croceicoccus naphthovorans TaxID=1348774 RepID=UPI00069EB468|nr:hypothetical protein [Croceicoccus naphthovorans]MBB3991653.1 Fur family zinc uptake transcriptional regulator [Croceicoccus naphthovorans]
MAKRTSEHLEEVVLAVLKETGGRSLSAYEIADAAPTRITPAQVYRTIERLAQRRCVKRIETLNAYVALSAQCAAVSVCTECEIVQPVSSQLIGPAVKDALAQTDFSPGRTVIEILGLCRHCREVT